MQFENFDIRVVPGALLNKLVVVTGLAAVCWMPIVATVVWLAR